MPRFFLDQDQIRNRFIVLTGEQAAHMKVLRMREGELVTVCNGSGTDYRCRISDVSADQVCLVVEHEEPSDAEACVSVSVYMAYAKGDKLEHVIQKATELGAAEILAFPSSRCVVRLDGKTREKKLARWQKIAASAAEQSGRGMIPAVYALDSYEAALGRAAQAETALFFYENEQSHTLSSALSAKLTSVALITGPEGGFTEAEVDSARDHGMQICTLGKRILRCETAPLCALSAVMFAAGEY
ncbi:MAG: 16S rRNA (uracil(1498)-N(3))-methyltransferase [Oscillospiraceae bacterium]|nr:16S rRNA (uracil(1498)-N(3))-methyltransferase [Oscillospiraceae bacterium]